MFVLYFLFFFSSRRRHTRCSRDWSSDVCSSDLGAVVELHVRDASDEQIRADSGPEDVTRLDFDHVNPVSGPVFVKRSEERRVGKECRSRLGTTHLKTKIN